MGLLGDYLDSLSLRKTNVKKVRRSGGSTSEAGRIAGAFSKMRAKMVSSSPTIPLPVPQEESGEEEVVEQGGGEQPQQPEGEGGSKLLAASIEWFGESLGYAIKSSAPAFAPATGKSIGSECSEGEEGDYLTGEEEEEEESEDSEDEEYTGPHIDHPSVLNWDWD